MYECTNCNWKGNELTKQSDGAMWDDKCPVCGDEVRNLDNTHEVIEKNKDNETENKNKVIENNDKDDVLEVVEQPEKKLKDMTKDELNDYAARKYPNMEIKYWWNKSKILKKIMESES